MAEESILGWRSLIETCKEEIEQLRGQKRFEDADRVEEKLSSIRRAARDLDWDIPEAVSKLLSQYKELNHLSSLPQRFAPTDIFPSSHCIVLGRDPWSRATIYDSMDTLEITPVSVDFPCEVVVCGETGWSHEEFAQLIRDRRGMGLKVYSQQLYMWWIRHRRDPYQSAFLRRAGAFHPALRYLSTYSFDWPSGFVHESHGGLIQFSTVQTGVLGLKGYRVGASGLGVPERRAVLKSTFEDPWLPRVQNESHMKEWGAPFSSTRLQKMANCLSTFAVNAARRTDSSMAAAILDWTQDLEWLRETYYTGQYDGAFSWPDTRVR